MKTELDKKKSKLSHMQLDIGQVRLRNNISQPCWGKFNDFCVSGGREWGLEERGRLFENCGFRTGGGGRWKGEESKYTSITDVLVFPVGFMVRPTV